MLSELRGGLFGPGRPARPHGEGMGSEAVFRGRIYGSTTVGERGQLVVPAEARKDFGFEVGEKIIVMAHGMGVLLLRADVVAQMVQDSMNRLADLERKISETSDQTEPRRE